MVNKIWTLPTHWIVHLLFHWKTYQWKIGRFKINVDCTNIVDVPTFSLLSVFRITLTLKCVSLNFWMLIKTRVHIIVVHSRLCLCYPTALIFICSICHNNLNSYYHLWSFLCFALDYFKVCQVKQHWNRCGKRINCSYWAMSAFVTIISTLFNYHTIIYRDFLYFVLDNF